MKRWVTGMNKPGSLPVQTPVQHDSWSAAADYLLNEIGKGYDENVFKSQRRAGHEAVQYLTARTVVMQAKPDCPVTVWYRGQVYWLADVPEEWGG